MDVRSWFLTEFSTCIFPRDSTVHLAAVRPNAPHFTDGANEAGGGEVTTAYHVHLDKQDPQGEALPQALQPLVDVVWVEVVVAEAGGAGEREELGGLGLPETPGALLHSPWKAEGVGNRDPRLGEVK